MTQTASTDAPPATSTGWRTFAQALARPYPVTLPMIALLVLVPFYVFIAQLNAGRTLHVLETSLDAAVPLVPAWALVYGTAYLFLILLPVFVIRREQHVRRTFLAYVVVWLAAYGIFLLYPTRASRPDHVAGDGFAAWGLRFLYDADPPYNCFPSLHVAHSFVSALTCYRVAARVGFAAVAAASLVALSTLFTKQHYVVDVLAGVLLACGASLAFIHGCAEYDATSIDRQAAPAVAIWTAGMIAAAFARIWVAYAAAHL